jgi:hypothetical protein
MRFSAYKLMFGLFVVANTYLGLPLLVVGEAIINYYHVVKVICVKVGLSISGR